MENLGLSKPYFFYSKKEHCRGLIRAHGLNKSSFEKFSFLSKNLSKDMGKYSKKVLMEFHL
jgi:hypothetical protein